MGHATRREFLKTAGQGTLAAGIGFHLPKDAWLTAVGDGPAHSAVKAEETRLECDVLVVGGGFAGCFAAIKAREQGAQVILIDKGFVGKAGQSPFASSFSLFNPAWGHKMEQWMENLNAVSEYVNNRYWTEKVLLDSQAIFDDLVSWGVEFKRDAKGNLLRLSQGREGMDFILYAHSVRNDGPSEKNHVRVLRERALKVGVKILDRMMAVELLKQQDGRVAGAVGIRPDSFAPYIFLAKTTVFGVGAASFKPIGYPPLVSSTGDGESMAFRAGADVLGKEFISNFYSPADAPSLIARRGLPPELDEFLGADKRVAGQEETFNRINGEGTAIPTRPAGVSEYPFSYTENEFEIMAGRGPVFWRNAGRDRMLTGGATAGMCLRKADGLWPANHDCASSVPGLYAAGDALGTMQNGAAYFLRGASNCGCSVTGAIAGRAAAKEAARLPRPSVSEKEIARARDYVSAPSLRRGGYSPRWVHQYLMNTTMPYFISDIKKADRLEAALTMIGFMQQHLAPALIARDPHELRLAHETRDMILVAEMRLRSALFRTESRGHHYREDFPRRDDPNWLAWSKIVNQQGKMNLVKVLMPKEYWPDLSKPYRERYPMPFPGEEKL